MNTLKFWNSWFLVMPQGIVTKVEKIFVKQSINRRLKRFAQEMIVQ